MGASVVKKSIDLGIVTYDSRPMIHFYQNLLGFKFHSESERDGTTITRLMCGDSMIKILQHAKNPEPSPPGGIRGGTGYRYWTITVDNLKDIVAQCEDNGGNIAMPITEIAPGVLIAMVEDPDGNWVEFLQ